MSQKQSQGGAELRSFLAVNTAVLLFGTAGIFGKLLTFSPLLIVLGRVAFASLSLALYILIKSRISSNEGKLQKRLTVRSTHLLLMVFLGVVLAVHWLTFFYSIQISTVAIGLLSFSTFPIYTAILEPLILKEKFIGKYVLLALISLLGIRLLIPQVRLSDSIVQGVIWGSVSGILFALLTVINKKLVFHYPSDLIAMYQNFIAFICLFPLSLRLLYQIRGYDQLIMLVVLGVVFTAVSHSFFIYGLKTIPARLASIIACLEPVYGIIFAIILLDEIPSLRTISGGLVIIATVVYASVFMKHNRKKDVEELYERDNPH